MKKIYLPALFFLFFNSNNSFSQKISYRSLIGEWEVKDSGSRNFFMILEFADSINCSLRTNKGLGKFRYSLETTSGITIIRLNGINNNGVEGNLYLLIKFIKSGFFKFQENKGDKENKWDDNETKNNTFFLMKKSGVVSPPG